MKKILVLSDTHSFIDNQILKFVKQVNEVWHIGDIGNIEVTNTLKMYKPLRAVYGNIDDITVRSEFPLYNRFIVDEVDVLLTHIGGTPNNYELKTKKILETKTPKLFITGHSHILKIMFDKKLNLLYMNPGSAGKYGYHKIRTMLQFVLDKGEIKKLEIIELGQN